MLVYNRDSLADVSGDLELRFRDAPGVAAEILPRLQQLLEHKRAIVAFPATIGGRRKYVQVQLRFPNAERDRDSRASWRWWSTPRTCATPTCRR